MESQLAGFGAELYSRLTEAVIVTLMTLPLTLLNVRDETPLGFPFPINQEISSWRARGFESRKHITYRMQRHCHPQSLEIHVDSLQANIIHIENNSYTSTSLNCKIDPRSTEYLECHEIMRIESKIRKTVQHMMMNWSDSRPWAEAEVQRVARFPSIPREGAVVVPPPSQPCAVHSGFFTIEAQVAVAANRIHAKKPASVVAKL